MAKLTFSMENYLEAIYELSLENKGVRLTDLAERMGVTKASANNAMAVLIEKGLADQEKYQEIFLTEKGMKLAEFTSRKHQTIQQFFIQVLHIDAPTADEDACAIEHVISEESILAMERFLDAYLKKKQPDKS